MSKKVIMIVTSHSSLGDTGKPTGLYLSELAHPHEVLSQAGCQLQVASPVGQDAPIDPKSLSDELAQYAQYAKNTLLLDEVVVSDYDAFFVVGGHGAMWDLPGHPEIQRIFSKAYEQQKVLAAVCHGSAALVKVTASDGEFLIKGKKVTGFTNEEEAAVGLTEVMPFSLEDGLKASGGDYVGLSKWKPNVIVDERLITGQNPASARGVAEAVAKLLQLQPVAI